MAEATITVQEIQAPFDNVTAGDLHFTYEAGDNVNGMEFACTGRELILVRNDSGGAAGTFTVSSVETEKNRTEDITTYSLADTENAVVPVGLTNSKGWKQTDGNIILAFSAATMMVAVIRLPAGVGR
jgi:hypothetical protein